MGVIEALACGKPILLRDNGDPDAYFLEKKGLCLLFKRRREIISKIEQLLAYHGFNPLAVSFARNLDWNNHISKLIKIYRQLVA